MDVENHSIPCSESCAHFTAVVIWFYLWKSLGRMLNVRLEFASQCRRVQGFVWTPGWAVSLTEFILPSLKSHFLTSLATVAAGNWVSFLKWPGLSMRSQPFENQGLSSQYPFNTPKIHEPKPPSGSPGGSARLQQAPKTTQQFSISVCVKHRRKLSKAAVKALMVC